MAVDGITIIDVFRAMKVDPVPRVTWSVGARTRDLYEMIYGRPAAKRLRSKTNSGGSHCFNIYPHHFFDRIAEIIRMHETEVSRQGELPF